jgi:hypothetical protein
VRGIADIGEDREPAQTRDDLAKEFKPLAATSGDWSARPVTLPPGWAKLVTMPERTGSAATAKTIGMTVVACLAASTAPPVVTMTFTLSWTNSAAISA